MQSNYLKYGFLALGILVGLTQLPAVISAEGQPIAVGVLPKKPVLVLDVNYSVREVNGVKVEDLRGVVPVGIKSFFVENKENSGIRISFTYDGVIGGGDGLGGEFFVRGLASDGGRIFNCSLQSYEMKILESKSSLNPSKNRENLQNALGDLTPRAKREVLMNPNWYLKLECSRVMRSPE